MHIDSKRRLSRRLVRRTFTLVEIMVVVVIIGMVLGLVGVFAINRLNLAKVKNTRNQLLALGNAIDTYYLDVGKYPQSLNDLVSNPGLGRKWQGPYLRGGQLPKDAWGNDFQYDSNGSGGNDYDIYSYGQDNAPGGTGLNEDIYPNEQQE